MQGNVHNVQGTNTMEVCNKSDIPNNQPITYGSVVCDFKPLKVEKYRCRLVVGGDKLPYTDDAAAPAANLLETKLMLNSTISQAGSKFFGIDIKDFFLSSYMDKPEYMRLNIKDIPDDIILQYNLKEQMDANGQVYFRILKGMYGLKQAAKLAYEQLKRNQTLSTSSWLFVNTIQSPSIGPVPIIVA